MNNNDLLLLAHESYKASVPAGAPPKPLRQITAPRGAEAAFQVIVQSNLLRVVNVASDAALTPNLSLPRYRVEVASPFGARLFLEKLLPDNEGALYADILTDCPALEYDAVTPSVIYAEIPIPRDAAPGVYDIAVRAYVTRGVEDETLAAQETVALTVHPYILPDPAERGLYVDLWQHNSTLARAYGVPLWSERHFDKIRQVFASLEKLGQRSLTVLAGDCPWRGWGCYLTRRANLFEYGMVPISRDESGAFRYDFSVLRRYLRLGEEYHITGDVTVYGLLGIWSMPLFPERAADAWAEKLLIRYRDADGAYRYMDQEQDILDYFRALMRFFQDEGWGDRVRIGADEPKRLEEFRRGMALLQSAVPETRFKMAIDHARVLRDFTGEIADCAASFPCATRERAFLSEYKGDKRILWYVCNIPDQPNTLLDGDLLGARLLGSLNYALGYHGFLRWAYTAWNFTPCEDTRAGAATLPAGDGCLTYPAPDGGLWLSLRWKALRRGFEDHELLLRAAKARGLDFALSALRAILPDDDFEGYMADDRRTRPGVFVSDAEAFEAMREKLMDVCAEETKEGER